MSEEKKRIYLSPPHMSGYEKELIDEALETNWIAPLGPHVDAFERELADYVGVKGALALSSGTAAIHLALRLLGVGIGDTVFCSTLTFVGSVNPILYLGATPVFIDSEPETWNLSPEALERAFQDVETGGKIPKAVIVVNLYGQSADVDRILNICNYYGVPIIEDAAESLGATYKGRASGTFGKFGIYSFNGNKIITTSGGGMLISEDIEAINKARFWATQARDTAEYYQHSEVGYNYRLSNILAAIGRGQLKVLDERINARRFIFNRYSELLSEFHGLNFMPEASFGRSTRWLTTLTVDPDISGVSSKQIINTLSEQNIEARHVWKPMHLQPLFNGCSYYRHSDTSVSDYLFENGLCLPSGSAMTENDLQRVVECLDNYIKPKDLGGIRSEKKQP
ncbi:MAG: pyridoxal phosphate-dependent aminotransferase [Peptococcaceae bacterium BICA1-7]|nr:MAG: pyridoxal phosphate-dependent aminotransferase [Peptococcaceae bacterium BICA1-7]